MELVFITGLSGAGKSQAMKAFEDNGYYCIDNMPPSLIPKFVELLRSNSGDISKTALVVDIRGGIFFDDYEKNLESLSCEGIDYKIVYLEASDKELVKRFKEARRTHPLRPNGSILEGIQLEKAKLLKIRDKADYIVDTSHMNLSKFKQEIFKNFNQTFNPESLSLTFMSFGYKKGIPLDADLVYDLRMLPNPYYIEDLKHQTGNDSSVQDYVMSFEQSKSYMEKIVDMIEFLIPLAKKEGRKQFVIALGCTGGQHRSVTFANKLNERFINTSTYSEVIHREL